MRLLGKIEGEICNEILMCAGISTMHIRTERNMVLVPLEFRTWVCGTVNLRRQAIVDRSMEEDRDFGVEGME